jgi:homopolymeric O-antigen transport system ATP-binding protein
MNSDIFVRVDGVSKKFSRSLKRSIIYAFKDTARDLAGMQNNCATLRPDEFWGVRNISFELKRGHCLGIIGPNGSGKSTLLKMINGIIDPDTGMIEVRGRTGGLIEVGSGFHPQLTGRENVYVNGALLGMGKKKIDQNFDEIVEFAGLQDAIDAPVKYYSSGMYVRLGFAVASRMEPDVLLIDEILAVGDAGFRAKCYQRIIELSKNSAVIFVSHNMSLISRLCSECIVLNGGKTLFHGSTPKAVRKYLSLFSGQKHHAHSSGVKLSSLSINGKKQLDQHQLKAGAPVEIEIVVESDIKVDHGSIALHFISLSGDFAAEYSSDINGEQLSLDTGKQSLHISLDELRLNPGAYQLSLIVTSQNRMEHLLWVHCGWKIEIAGSSIGSAAYQINGHMEQKSYRLREALTTKYEPARIITPDAN